MVFAISCSALLGLLVFGLGLLVSVTRVRGKRAFDQGRDPAEFLTKAVRAHQNATQYAPMLAVLMLIAGANSPSDWTLWVMGLATAARYLHALGMLASRSLERAHPLRLIGAAGTYAAGFALCLAALDVATMVTRV